MKLSIPFVAVILCAFVSVHCSSPLDRDVLLVVDEKTNNKLSVSKVDATVDIYGSIAETRLAVTFSNSTSRILEASVNLPLTDGASVTGYELEVDGKLREGVIVDKDLGRQAFENVIRQEIDPGLLEKGEGNSFKTRIYPVPAKGSKTFVLSYVEPLKYDSSGRGKYSLPVSLRSRVDDFRLKLKAQGVQVFEKNKLLGKDFVQSKRVHRSNFRSGSVDLILQKDLGTRTGIVSKGRDGKKYFYVDGGQVRDERGIAKPKLVQLVWDASHSSKSRNIDSDVALLNRYFQHFGSFDVDLKVVRNRVASFGRYTVRNGQCEKLLETLKALQFDGSSELDDVSYNSSKYDLSLLFSDGIGEVSEAKVKHPVYVVNSSVLEGSAYLNYLVRVSGGKKVSSQNQDALSELVTISSGLSSISGGVSEVRIFHSNGSSYAVGRLTGDENVTLHYGTKKKTVASESVQLVNIADSYAPSLLWARSEEAVLSLNKYKNRTKIVKLAQQHHLVTDFTSLIVLDRIEDYAKYRIVPKDENLKRKYYKVVKDVEEYKQGKLADLNVVYADWKKLKDWHQGKYKKVKPLRSGDFAVYSAAAFVVPSSSNIITAGNRSGDFSITADSIDFFLNNPEKSGNKTTTSINLKEWDPDTEYSRNLKKASSSSERKQIYYAEKIKYSEVVSFYLDCARLFYLKGDKDFAYQVASNLAEIGKGKVGVIRLLGQQYLEWKKLDLALRYYNEVIVLRPEEPQSYRDLAFVYRAMANYQESADLLWKVVSREWDWRFNGIEMIALNEWNNLYAKKKKYIKLNKEQYRFVYNISVKVRVVLSWDTDNSDMDLLVTDPDGEQCYYGNKNTAAGGRISDDMTGGRGPEEFMIKSAKKGEYKVEANYFGSREQTLLGPTTVTVYFIKNWGRWNEERKQQTLRLHKTKEKVQVGTFVVE